MLSPAAVGGRRRGRRMSKATRRMLRMMKMKGGLEVAEGEQGQSSADTSLGAEFEAEEGGRRRRHRTRRHHRRHHRSRRAGLFA